jgi:hypothetical protein
VEMPEKIRQTAIKSVYMDALFDVLCHFSSITC